MGSITSFNIGDRPYTLKITGRVHESIRDATGISIFALWDDAFKLYRELFGDYSKLVRAIALSAGVTDSEYPEFLDAMTGDTLHAARAAFTEAIQVFFSAEETSVIKGLVGSTILMRILPREALVEGIMDALSSLASQWSESTTDSADSSA
jgi:hypothetical protein